MPLRLFVPPLTHVARRFPAVRKAAAGAAQEAVGARPAARAPVTHREIHALLLAELGGLGPLRPGPGRAPDGPRRAGPGGGAATAGTVDPRCRAD